MSIAPAATLAITNALSRFDRASEKLVDATSGGDEDAAEAIVEQIEAKAQFSAGVSTVRIADAMMVELLKLGQASE